MDISLKALSNVKSNMDEYKREYNFKGLANLDKDFKEYLSINIKEHNTPDELIDLLISKTHHEYYLIFAKSQKVVIGVCYLYQNRPEYGRCNVGLGLVSEYRGKGVAVEVMDLLVDSLMNGFIGGYTRVAVEIEDSNISSLNLMKKLSYFQYEGKLRNNYGEGVHSNVYSCVKMNPSNKQLNNNKEGEEGCSTN